MRQAGAAGFARFTRGRVRAHFTTATNERWLANSKRTPIVTTHPQVLVPSVTRDPYYSKNSTVLQLY
eukprot:COSAG01_NODE_4970_length_4580_cov_209.695827_4_plen_67_part_00